MNASYVNPELVQAAIARVHEQVDGARAVFRGLVLVGDRRSIPAGIMYWALPGGMYADGPRLLSADPSFRVIEEPSEHHLVDQQAVLRALT